MIDTQHQSCQVLLHPAACSSPAAISAIQQRTGLLVIITPKGHATAQLCVVAEPNGPFGDDAA